MWRTASNTPTVAWAVGSIRISTPASRMWPPPTPTSRIVGSIAFSCRARLPPWMSPDVSVATMKIVVTSVPSMRAHFLEDHVGGLHGPHAVLAGDDRLAPVLDGLEEALDLARQRLLLLELHFLDRIEFLGDRRQVGEVQVAVLRELRERLAELRRGPVDPRLLRQRVDRHVAVFREDPRLPHLFVRDAARRQVGHAAVLELQAGVRHVLLAEEQRHAHGVH